MSHRKQYDSKLHNGALAKVGVKTGWGSNKTNSHGWGGKKTNKGYVTSGRWQVGDQETQLKVDKGETVMRRRTVTQGGKLYGAAHDAPQSMTYGARPNMEQRNTIKKAWG